MKTPDLTQDRELVELAKELAVVNYRAWQGETPEDANAHWSSMGKRDKSVLLAMADAARTHLGSGYVLPPVTEANCDRLAQMRWQLFRLRDCRVKAWGEQTDVNRSSERAKAREWLNAIHAAFAPPQPKEDGKGLWIEPKDDVTKALDAEEEAYPDKPRRVLFTALASNPKLMEVLLNTERREDRVACIQRWASIFEEAACTYLAWRKQSRELNRCKS